MKMIGFNGEFLKALRAAGEAILSYLTFGERLVTTQHPTA